MICPLCKKEREFPETIAHDYGGTTTLMGFQKFIDDAGDMHVHNPNTVTRYFKCENGHMFCCRYTEACPAQGCDYHGEPFLPGNTGKFEEILPGSNASGYFDMVEKHKAKNGGADDRN